VLRKTARNMQYQIAILLYFLRFSSFMNHLSIIKKNSDMVIEGKMILLRELKPSDANDLYENVKDKAVVKWTLRIPHPYPRNGAVKFIKTCNANFKKKNSYTFGIVVKEIGKVVGTISLKDVDWNDRNAELGYWIGKNYWGKGYSTEAAKLITLFGFEELRLHRIYAKLFAENIPSRKVLEKAGYIFEGTFKEDRFRYGRWHDTLGFGLLNK
jgi:RimJ/RimL family protein N-acetyltransferase